MKREIKKIKKYVIGSVTTILLCMCSLSYVHAFSEEQELFFDSEDKKAVFSSGNEENVEPELFSSAEVFEEEIYLEVTDTTKVIAEGTCGDNIKWQLKDSGRMVISGEGMMHNYEDANKAPWYIHRSEIKEVSVLNGVTSIGSGAFYACDQIKNVMINSSLTEIGDYAFKECEGMFSIILPDSLEKIGSYAFYGCSGLGTIVIPGNVAEIREGAFASCGKLVSATINASLEELPEYAFNNCPLLSSVTLPETVKKIGAAAFDSCTCLSSITLPDKLLSIGTSAFAGTSIESIELPDTVTDMGDGVFIYCKKLTKVKLSRNLNTIPVITFGHCESLKEVNIPASVTSIGMAAFYNCNRLKEIVIPETVVSISMMTIVQCTSLEKVYFLGSDTSIGQNGIFSCPNLKKIIGYKNTAIERYATDNNFSFIALDDSDVYEMKLSETKYVYDGTEKKPLVRVRFDGEELELNKDYTVTYENCRDVGDAVVRVQGAGRYRIFLTGNFKIVPADLAGADITLSYTSCNYNGQAKKPGVVLKQHGQKLLLNKDYTVTYQNNKNAGKATVLLSGKNNYQGTKKAYFTINKISQNITAKSFSKTIGSNPFSFKAKTNGKGKLTYRSGSPSVASISASGIITLKKVGQTTIIITAAETSNYKKTKKEISVTVIPKKTSMIGAKSNSRGSITATWKENNTGNGYQIYYSTDKYFKKDTKSYFINKVSISAITINGLPEGKTYYIKIRSYKKVGTKMYYGPFSTVKSNRILS